MSPRRAALITGASRGIGAAIARELAPSHDLFLVARSTPAPSGVPPAAILGTITTDLAAPESADVVSQALRERGVQIAVLVNNAGIAPSAPLARTDDALLQETLALNLIAPVRLMRLLLPDMVKAGHGRVVNVASTAALVGYRYTAAYSASKAALVGVTRALAAEFAGRGVTINAVCPGFTDTDIVAEAVATVGRTTGKDPAQVRATLAGFNPQRRLLRPDEIAGLVAYLASDAAGAIHGQALAIDGGETA